MEAHTLSQRIALTHALDMLRYTIFRLAYAARGAVIRWSLALAKFLERGQAHAITRAATVRGLGPPAGMTIPPPSFPSRDRGYSPLPRAPQFLSPDKRPQNTLARDTTEVNEPSKLGGLTVVHGGPPPGSPSGPSIPLRRSATIPLGLLVREPVQRLE